MSELFGKQACPQRSAILHRIYEENLYLRNRHRPPPRAAVPVARLRSRRRNGLLMSAALLLPALGGLPLLITGSSHVPVSADLPVPTAEVATTPPPAAPAQEPPAAAETPAPPAAVAQVSAEHAATPAPPAAEEIEQAALDAAGILDPVAYAAPLAASRVRLRNLFGLSVNTIVIDAGHGGNDPGAIGRMGTREKDVTLDIAKRLKAKLEQDGHFRIVLVREHDTTMSLSRRVEYVNSFDTDLFISIHINSLPGTSSDGIETYYFGPHADDRALQLAERENRGSEYAVSDFEEIVRNMRDTIKFQESRLLAGAIQRNLLARFDHQDRKGRDRGVKTAPFVVLLGIRAPSVLAEISSLSSPEAERALRTEAYRDEIADRLAAGIRDYLKIQARKEKNNHGTARLAGH